MSLLSDMEAELASLRNGQPPQRSLDATDALLERCADLVTERDESRRLVAMLVYAGSRRSAVANELREKAHNKMISWTRGGV